MAEGYVMPMQMCWKLAQKWYAGRLDHDWQRPGQAQIQQLFEQARSEGGFLESGRENLS